MTHYQELMLVDASPDEVFRLVAGIESWQHLFPHVHAVRPASPGRWQVTYFWRWIPFTVTAAGRVDEIRRMAEYRFGHRFGTRVAVRLAVDEGEDRASSVRLDAEVVRVAPLFGPLVSMAVQELSRSTLEMVRLLAESDRIAHENIEN